MADISEAATAKVTSSMRSAPVLSFVISDEDAGSDEEAFAKKRGNEVWQALYS